MYTKEEFRKMIVSLDEPINDLILVFYDKNGIYIYTVIGLYEVDESIYDTDELYNCQVDEVVYASKDPHNIGALFDFNINDVEEIKDVKTEKILYKRT